MEYVDGVPVRPPGEDRKLLDIAVQIADGLSAAHVAGIVKVELHESYLRGKEER
jgi:hypothetical protein